MLEVASRTLRRVAGLPAMVLFPALVVVAGMWLFVAVARAVEHGRTQSVDERILLALRDPHDLAKTRGPQWLEEVGRDLTALGGIAELLLLTAAVSGYLLICRKFGMLALVLSATVGGLVLSLLLKDLFYRPRPTVVPYLSHVMSPSFPSGHSMLSAVVYLTLGSLLASLVERRALKLYFLAVAMLLTLLVGVSRVYMGVHYPTDVLAGWCAGLAWAVLCSLTARYLQHRGAVERGGGD